MNMAVEFYKCELCGNIIAVIKNGGGKNLVCCGQPMTHLVANTVDASAEKHTPAVAKEGAMLQVTVGSVEHPMLDNHYIEWIALACDGKLTFKYLKPGEAPKADFHAVDAGTVYAYCNLHGLWKAGI
jgi:superoxide reductase